MPPATLMSTQSNQISSSSPMTMPKSVVGICRQRSTNLSVESSRTPRRDSSFPSLNVTSTLRTLRRECFTCVIVWTDNSRCCRYREKVERNEIKLSLTDTWSAILYDEEMVEDGDELTGLLRSETLLRVFFFCSLVLIILTHSKPSAQLLFFADNPQRARGYIHNQALGHLPPAKRSATPKSTRSPRSHLKQSHIFQHW